MSPRDSGTRLAVILALLALAIIALVLTACGKHSSGNDDGQVDWAAFTTVQREGLRSSNLDELSNKVGFRFVLPSYLPAGISRTFLLSTQFTSSQNIPAFVELIPNDRSSPGIVVDEGRLAADIPAITSYGEGHDQTIDGILVGCFPYRVPDEQMLAAPTPSEGWPTLSPDQYSSGLECEWRKEGIEFKVTVGWLTGGLAPTEISQEQRDEAMKVVTSMIEDPYVP